jgi:prevent-host-death family protein
MVSDYGMMLLMEQMAISVFKAKCLAVLEKVRRTRRPILVTRFGEPVAEVLPPSTPPRPASWLGDMRGTGRIVGDIVAPAAEEGEWDALQ